MGEELKKFPRGARPSPRHKLLAATPHKTGAIPAQVAYVPKQMSYWLNNQDGDCVTAEEAFNKDVSGVFIQDPTVQTWAGNNGFLNGANLTDVMDQMAKAGFSQDGNIYGDGPYTSVDYSNEANLQSALAIAPVKIGIDASALPSTAGNGNGWSAFGGSPGQFNSEDHCVSLAGFGPASWLFQQLGAPVPSTVSPTKVCYLLFTWNSIGVVDHDWIMSTCGEAWLRNPSSLTNGTPLPNPGPVPVPPVPPTPPAPPSPPFNGLPWWSYVLIGAAAAGVVYLAVEGIKHLLEK